MQVRTCCSSWRRHHGFAHLVLSHAPVSVNNDYSGAKEVRHSLQGWGDTSVPPLLIDIRLEMHTCRFDALKCIHDHTTTINPPGSKQKSSIQSKEKKDDPELRGCVCGSWSGNLFTLQKGSLLEKLRILRQMEEQLWQMERRWLLSSTHVPWFADVHLCGIVCVGGNKTAEF